MYFGAWVSDRLLSEIRGFIYKKNNKFLRKKCFFLNKKLGFFKKKKGYNK